MSQTQGPVRKPDKDLEGVRQVPEREHQALYPIGVAEQLTGLTARQIRYYEANGLVSPQRTPGRQRLYSAADVERLKEVKALMARGLNLAEAREYLARRADRIRERGMALERGADPLLAEAPPSLTRDMRLTSLYPVSNRATLVRLIDREGRRENTGRKA